MSGATIEQVRSFNRTVTQRVGVLQDEYLARGRPLGASRVLWEVGRAPVDVRALRARLDLDSGYLSRLLRSLEAEGLVVVEPDATDRRVRTVRLTAAGRAERAVLDRESDALAESLLAPLGDGQRERLVAAMARRRAAPHRGPGRRRGRGPAQRGGAVLPRRLRRRAGRHASRAASTPPAAARSTRPPSRRRAACCSSRACTPSRSRCGALKLPPGEPAEIKRLWVAPDARRLGVARRVLAELEAQARQAGADGRPPRHEPRAARGHDAVPRGGLHEVAAFNDEPYAHHWFEKRLRACNSVQ